VSADSTIPIIIGDGPPPKDYTGHVVIVWKDEGWPAMFPRPNGVVVETRRWTPHSRGPNGATILKHALFPDSEDWLRILGVTNAQAGAR
jgi:hypothetical protein